MSRVFVVGWDGATFDLIRPWIEERKLPTVRRLMDHGVQGPLRSTIPPWSFQAWTSFMTGKNPGKHGVYDFFRSPVGTYDLQFVNAGHRRGGATLWQILSQAGRRVIAIGIPGTFPPDAVNGVMISGFDFPGEGPGTYLDRKGIYPREMLATLHREVGPHPIDPPILNEMKEGRYDVALERIIQTIERQAATAKYLMQHHPWDCFMVVFGASDGVSHYFWQYFDPQSPFYVESQRGVKDGILRVYQELDRQLGEMVSLMPDDTFTILMSDHGSGGVSNWVIFPNLWLQEQHLITLRRGTPQRLARIRQRMKQWGIAALPARLQRLLYRNALQALGRYEARVRYGIIDWSRTQAYFDENPYYPVIRVNLRRRQPQGIVEPGAAYERVRDRLIEALESWRHPITGDQLVEKAYRREEIYNGESLEEAADVVPKWALHRGYNYGFRLSAQAPGGAWIHEIDPLDTGSPFYPRKFSSHRDQAILVAKGPGIDAGATIDGARVIDIAPTILRWLEVPVPADMDGCVLDLATRGAGWPATRGVA